MEASGPSGPAFSPLGAALQNEVQNEHNDDGQDNNGRRSETEDVFNLQRQQ